MLEFRWLFIYGFALLILDFAIGIVIGWWLRGVGNNLISKAVTAKQALSALRRLYELTREVSSRVGEHLTSVDSISKELIALRTNGKGPKDQAVVDAVSRIVQVNEELTERLTDAKLRLRQQEQIIERQASAALTDLATGLPNRKAFDDELRRSFAQYQLQETPLSIVLIDIDNLAELQAQHGKEPVDAVLKGVADVLLQTVRAMDFVARYEEDQFALMLPGTKADEAKEAADKTRRAIAEKEFQIHETPVNITVSEGVAESLPGDDLRSLVRRTHSALEASLEAGRNCSHMHDGVRCRRIVPSSSPPGEIKRLSEANNELGWAAPAEHAETVPLDANTDPLTGLFNRRGFFEALRNRVSEHNIMRLPLSLVLLDVDLMQDVNKNHGQLVGDMVLRAITQIIRGGLRTGLDVAARYEEDRFAIVLIESELYDGAVIGDRIRRAIAACKLRAEGAAINISVSVGAAQLARGADSVALIKMAGQAMRSAKAAGRNCTHVYDGYDLGPFQALPGVPTESTRA